MLIRATRAFRYAAMLMPPQLRFTLFIDADAAAFDFRHTPLRRYASVCRVATLTAMRRLLRAA